ncbi:MAG: oligopeptide/dipeptide ABC transporter ATP-binding protein [Nitrososphaerota archaeon]
MTARGEIPMTARGEIPSLIAPPTGCRFHPHCPYAMPVCRERFPGRSDLGNGHWAQCFLYGEGKAGSDGARRLSTERTAPA